MRAWSSHCYYCWIIQAALDLFTSVILGKTNVPGRKTSVVLLITIKNVCGVIKDYRIYRILCKNQQLRSYLLLWLTDVGGQEVDCADQRACIAKRSSFGEKKSCCSHPIKRPESVAFLCCWKSRGVSVLLEKWGVSVLEKWWTMNCRLGWTVTAKQLTLSCTYIIEDNEWPSTTETVVNLKPPADQLHAPIHY